jgi:hypothetical protein
LVGRKAVIVSVTVTVLLVASFFLGELYSPFGGIVSRSAQSVGSAPGVTVGLKQIEPQPTPPSQDRMVVYNAYISLETSDMQAVLNKIAALAENSGGYVAGSSRTTDSAEITIRVPKVAFRSTIQQVETYGKVLNERSSSEDVTQQYIDLKARLENMQRQEQRLRHILNMTETVDEVLQVERELERVRGDIESLQGQVNYIERNEEMSLISIDLTEPPPPFTVPGMDWKETFETALTGLFVVVRGLIILLVSLLPIAVIGVGAYYAYRRYRAGTSGGFHSVVP